MRGKQQQQQQQELRQPVIGSAAMVYIAAEGWGTSCPPALGRVTGLTGFKLQLSHTRHEEQTTGALEGAMAIPVWLP